MSRRFPLLLLAIVLASAACAPFAGRPDRPAQRVYLLEGAEAVPALQREPGCHLLLINSPRATSGFTTSRFAYRRSNPRIEYFAYHRWSDSPARMFHSLLVAAAEQSNIYRGVITTGAPVEGDLRLDSEIMDLSQHFGDDGGSHVRFAVRVRLYGGGRLLGGDVFEVSEPAEPNPQSGVQAANRASGRVLRRIMQFTQDTLAENSPRCPGSG